MPRQLTLRQIEAFKAVIENGSVSRSAELLNISQPAMSKLIAHLEFDTGLKLFDRPNRRLVPTEHAMRLYEEIGRVFAGVRQVENAVDAIRREEQGRLAIGVMTALSGAFIQRATMGLLKKQPNVFCSIHTLGAQQTVDRLLSRKLDVGLTSDRIDNPNVVSEPLMVHPLVCIMSLDHPLAPKAKIGPRDLDQIPFVTVDPEFQLGRLVDGMFMEHGIHPHIALVADRALTVCEFVAAGLGVSLVHPLMASGLEHRLAVRLFQPEITYGFQLCRFAENKPSRLVDTFAAELRATGTQISRSMLDGY